MKSVPKRLIPAGDSFSSSFRSVNNFLLRKISCALEKILPVNKNGNGGRHHSGKHRAFQASAWECAGISTFREVGRRVLRYSQELQNKRRS